MKYLLILLSLAVSAQAQTLPADIEDTPIMENFEHLSQELRKISRNTTFAQINFTDGTTQTTAFLGSAGIVLQRISSSTNKNWSARGTAIPKDNTIPQIDEGWQVLVATITPQNSSSLIVVEAVISYVEVVNACNEGAMCFYIDDTADALACMGLDTSGGAANNEQRLATLVYEESAASTTERNYSVRIGCEAAGIISVNGGADGILRYGNTVTSTLVIKEIGQ